MAVDLAAGTRAATTAERAAAPEPAACPADPGLAATHTDLAAAAMAAGRQAGLDAVGIAPATPFAAARRAIEERKAAGLHAGMHFTYGNPARSTDPSAALPGARALVVGARSYLRRPPAPTPATPATHATHTPATPATPATHTPATAATPVPDPRPAGRVARYAWEDHYGPLREALAAVAAVLEAAGYRARVLADSNHLVDREAAYRAGLGSYGKNANLLLAGRGSWFVLGAVLTDAPLPPSRPDPHPGGCGTCTRCIAACPTGAIVAPGVIDARRCLAWVLQAPGPIPVALRAAVGDRIYGCDDCQEVCPPNRTEARRRPPPPATAKAEATVDLLEVLATPDAELDRRFARWYVPRRQGRYIRRNALVALGNVADPDDPAVGAALTRALGDPDPLIVEHAEWAARRLGRHDLLAARR